MSSRQVIKHNALSQLAPPGQVGDEWFNTSTNKLYKFIAVNGLSPQWIEIPLSFSTVGEKVTLVNSQPTLITATPVQFDLMTQSILYFTAPTTANWTVNFRGSSTVPMSSMMPVGQSITAVVMVTNSATAFYSTAISIDGVTHGVKWQGGTAPSSGNANATDVYSYTIIRLNTTTYSVIGSQTKFS